MFVEDLHPDGERIVPDLICLLYDEDQIKTFEECQATLSPIKINAVEYQAKKKNGNSGWKSYFKFIDKSRNYDNITTGEN